MKKKSKVFWPVTFLANGERWCEIPVDYNNESATLIFKYRGIAGNIGFELRSIEDKILSSIEVPYIIYEKIAKYCDSEDDEFINYKTQVDPFIKMIRQAAMNS